MSKEMIIEEQNAVIALFDGFRKVENHPEYGVAYTTHPGIDLACRPALQLEYHSSWDWLMPVYEKIKKHYYKTYEGNKDQDYLKRIFGNIQHQLLEANIENFRLNILVYIDRLQPTEGIKK